MKCMVIFLSVALMANVAIAEDVYFADENLENAVAAELGTTPPISTTEILDLISLSAYGQNIYNITGIEYATNIEYLGLWANHVEDISPLSGLTNLWMLNLGVNQVSDISALSGLTNLTYLDLVRNQVSDISALAGLYSLDNLYIGNNQISDISALSGLTNLENLGLHRNQVSDISVLAGLHSLGYLQLSYNQISDISALSGLTNLWVLFLEQNQITNIPDLSGLTNLWWLELSHNQISDISTLSGMTNLERLELDDNQISDISALSGLMNLEILDISSNPLNEDAYSIYIPQILENNPSIDLKYDKGPPVYFADPNLQAAIEEALGTSSPDLVEMLFLITLDARSRSIANLVGLEYATNLEGLYLGDNNINDISPISGLTDLQRVDLSKNRVSDISALSGLTNLWYLKINNNYFSDISALSGMTNLWYLSLSGNQVTDISVLSSLANLLRLYASHNQISDVYALFGMTNLVELELGGNQINGISAISGLINLEKLEISDNQVGDISAVSGLGNISYLDLRGNHITDIPIVSGLTNLSYLDLYDNQISEISALSSLTNLERLCLGSNPLNENAYNIYIPQILENNPGIDLRSNLGSKCTLICNANNSYDANNWLVANYYNPDIVVHDVTVTIAYYDSNGIKIHATSEEVDLREGENSFVFSWKPSNHLAETIIGETVDIVFVVSDDQGVEISNDVQEVIIVNYPVLRLIEISSDGFDEKDLIFADANSQSCYLIVPRDANVASAHLKLIGSSIDTIIDDCYQESADETCSCDGFTVGLDTGTYSFYADDNDARIGYFAVNYSKPERAIGATWKVKHGPADAYNVTIPSSCWNYDPHTLMLRLASQHDVPTANHWGSYGQCYNGSWLRITPVFDEVEDSYSSCCDSRFRLYDGDWNTDGSYLGGWRYFFGDIDAPRVYEEAIIWHLDDMYTNSPYLEVGTKDGIKEWSLEGAEFRGEEAVLDELSDGSVTKSLIYIADGNQTVSLKIPQDANVAAAYLNLSGYNNPTNPYLEVGIPDEIYEWSHTSAFDQNDTRTNDFSSAIDSFLSTCSADSNGYCEVPLLFHSDTAGQLEISNIKITYKNISITSDLSSALNYALNNGACDCNGCIIDDDCCLIPLLFYSGSAGIMKISNVRVFYEPTGHDKADLDGVDPVEYKDLSILVDDYLQTGPYLSGDINRDTVVDLKDFALLAKYWLTTCTCN